MKTLDDFDSDARTLSPSEFAERHGDAFLIHHGIRRKDKPISGSLQTLHKEGVQGEVNRAPELNFVVHSVQPSASSTFPDFISVGRTGNNDISLPDDSISRFQAFFRAHEGTYALTDCGSTNGTFIDDVPAPGKESQGTPLHPGARIRFGDIEATFLDAPAFQKLVVGLSPT